MRAWRSSKFVQIRPPTAELAARKCLKNIPLDLLLEKRCCHFFSAVLDQVLFILAGNNDMHKNLMSFKFGQIRPRTTKLAALERLKNDVATFSLLLFI